MTAAKTQLLSMFADLFDPQTVCEACGTVGEWERTADPPYCKGCHAGCGVAGCRDAYGEGRSPAEAALWRLGKHWQATRDAGAMLAFHAARVAYEAAQGAA